MRGHSVNGHCVNGPYITEPQGKVEYQPGASKGGRNTAGNVRTVRLRFGRNSEEIEEMY